MGILMNYILQNGTFSAPGTGKHLVKRKEVDATAV
jgi:hypothetical protein